MARRSFLLPLLLGGALLVLGACSASSTSTDPARSTGTTPSDPVVASYADTVITLSDFERAYETTNNVETPSADSMAAYREFLDQYLNYRLKVRAAQKAGLDTLTRIKKEIRSYRQKMARPRLMRTHVYEPLARSLYERKQQEVDVSHILVQIDPEAPPKDTAKAYDEISTIADSLERGVPFDDLAFRNSDDPSAQKEGKTGYRGRIGYVRAGQIVKPFEDRMYTVAPDSVSDIFRTRFGYHLLKVHDRRPARPPIRLSHIMLRPDEDSAGARQRLDSLRTEVVQRGADFAALAKTHSQDRRSASRGGDLGTVESPGALPPAFRTAVSRLDSVGAVSDVVRTRFGYHLIKLTGRETRQSFEASYESLKNEIADRPRVERRKAAFAQQVQEDTGVSVDTARILSAANVSSVDTLSRPLLSVASADTLGTQSVATLGDSRYTLNQLAQHVMQTDGGARMSVGDVIEDFLNDKALTYAGARLAKTDSSFAATMKEYRNGLLVFQFMQDSVWTAAAQDTAGLRRTFRQNREEYRYPDRVRALALRAPADSLLAPYQRLSQDTASIGSLVERANTDSLVTADTILVTDTSPEVYHPVLSARDGTASGPVQYDGSSVLLVRESLLPSRQKTFEEARSSVISDYQETYEDRVIARLRRRYEAKTHPARLQKAFSDTRLTRPTSTP